MSRTSEQAAADQALTAAVEQALRAYSDEQAWILTEYIVITSQHRFDDEGDTLTAVGCLYRDGNVPIHRALGLTDYAATRMRKHITDHDN